MTTPILLRHASLRPQLPRLEAPRSSRTWPIVARRCSKEATKKPRSTKNGTKLAQKVNVQKSCPWYAAQLGMSCRVTQHLVYHDDSARKASWQQSALSMAEEVSWNLHIHILCPSFNVQHMRFHDQFQADIWWQTTTSPFMRTNKTRRKRSPRFDHMDKDTGFSTIYFLLPPALTHIPRKSKKHVQRKIKNILSCTWQEGPTDCN